MKHSVLLVLLWILLAPGSAFSWGREGHRIIAKIAAQNLSPDVRKRLAAILQTKTAGLGAAMADAAVWPDEIDKQRTKTEHWHFVDAPVAGPFSIGALCNAHDCVIDRIQEMSRRLETNQTGFRLARRPRLSRPMTSQELAFLIHLVGDLHQPLHAANNGDRGGNCQRLTKPLVHTDDSMTTEVHAAWDVDEVLAVMNSRGNEDAIAAALFQQFKTGAPVPQGTIIDWARESNELARRDVYRKLSIPNHTAPAGRCAAGITNVNITQQYLEANRGDVEQQLMRAGIRLSNILNKICKGDGCQARPRL